MKKAKDKRPFYTLSEIVSKTNKKDDFDKQTTIVLWANRYKENAQKGYYDIAFEYIAMWDLLQVKAPSKAYRLYFWKCFVRDFRRAYSNYEFEIFQSLPK